MGGIVAAALGCLYHFRWLMTAQQPTHGEQMWGYVSIRQGEKWNVCMTNGQLRTVSGPNVICTWGATLLQLKQFSATRSQYLLIEHLNGQSEIVEGPVATHMDTSVHKGIKVKDAISLTEHEVLVVYRDQSASSTRTEQPSRGEREATSSQQVSRHVI